MERMRTHVHVTVFTFAVSFFPGMTAVICTYPLDVVRVRLAFQVKGEHTYSGIIHAFKTIYAKVLHPTFQKYSLPPCSKELWKIATFSFI
jgi:hypothetical protein